MKAIWKFPLQPITRLKVPTGARPLAAQVKGDDLCLWMLCDPSRQLEERIARAVMTGEEFDDTGFVFVDTVQIGPIVGHVFVEEPVSLNE